MTGAPRADAPTPPTIAPGGRADDWPQIWFSLTQRPWSSLAIVPARPGTSTYFAARAIAEVARMYDAGVEAVDAERVSPAGVAEVIAAMADRAASGGRTIVALASPLQHHAAIPVARAADAALLVVPLGEAELAEAERTVASIGAARFVGSIATSDAD